MNKHSISITNYRILLHIRQRKRRPTTPPQPNDNVFFLSNFNTLHATNAIHKAFAIRNINLYIAAYAYLTIRLFATSCKGLGRKLIETEPQNRGNECISRKTIFAYTFY